MPTHPLLNGLSANLQSSESWTQQQALDMLRQTLDQSMSHLLPAQRLNYVRLQRAALTALTAVEDENRAIVRRFKTDGITELQSKIGGLNPESAFINTRYLEEVSQPLPWEPRTSRTRDTSRFRRALDEWKYREHISSMSLWDAACLNFDFATGVRTKSGHTYVDASYLTGTGTENLTVPRFIEISREMNLGDRLQKTLKAALGKDGKLRQLIEVATRACLLFEALEAYRNRADTGVTQAMYEQLVQGIDGSGPALAFETLSMNPAYVVFTPAGSTVPVPLLLIRVASLGVLSYFPFRPGGTLQYHADAQAANTAFMDQLKASHRKGDLGWFTRQLPLGELNSFKRLLTEEPRPKGLSPLAGLLYDGFHKLFPERTLEDLRFAVDAKVGPPETLLEALNYRHVQRYQADLSSLASTRSERDLQAVIDGAAAIADEVLQLLLTPMPGGVSGLNRIMQVVVFGSLAYSVITGVDEAIKGEASKFAAAMADVADLAVSGLLISTAGRVHRQRMVSLLQRLGNPRKVTHGDGRHELWKPDIDPYASPDQNLLNGQTPNASGIYTLRGKLYVWLQHHDQRRVVEVRHDVQSKRFVLLNEQDTRFSPPIVFDPAQQAWKLDLHNAHTLSDLQLAERMLPNGSSAVPTASLENLLRSTATTRATLDRVWRGEPAPVNLTEGVRRLQADRLIDQLTTNFHRRGYMPAHAESTVLCLLTQLPTWPLDTQINVHDAQGQLMKSYAGKQSAGASPHAINLQRRDDGSYIALGDQQPGAAKEEQLFELILDRQPSFSTLGKEGSPQLTQAQRIARLRLQISEQAKTRRIELFTAMTRYAGHARGDVPAQDKARDLLPLKAAPGPLEVTPLLKKMRELYPPLTAANLAQLLEQQPLSPAREKAFLEGGTLPVTLHDYLEQHRVALRIDAAIDGLYHPRAYNPDNDEWAREFASYLVRNTLKRHFVITEVVDGVAVKPYVSSGPEDTTIELRHYADERYEAQDLRNGGTIAVTPQVDSFYLAIGSVLQPNERRLLGMNGASDAKGLRKTLGDLMSNQRSPEGFVNLLNGSLGQYEQTVVLPADLKPAANGIYELAGQNLLPLYGSLYPIMFDKSLHKWRLKHPKKIGVDTPTLEHNHQGAWRLSSENPSTWDDHSLFYRLGHSDYNVDQATSAHILEITDTPASALREVHWSSMAAPPLLEDTSKRFRIEREVLHFIDAMSTYSAIRNARPDLQLLILSSLPGWPKTHVLQVVDSQGKVLKQFPANAAQNAQSVTVTQADSQTANVLKSTALNDHVIRAILGELPGTQEERLFKLAKQIARYAHQERAQLFDTLYHSSERNRTLPEQRFKAHHPKLPGSAIRAILDQATPKEIKQLQEQDQVGLRLDEQARLTTDDVRLNRAYEGLYRDTVVNPDSDKIVLHLLKSVSGWPANLRLDIHQDTAQGSLLESAGHLDGTDRRVLARIGESYQAYDKQLQRLNATADATDNLLASIVQVLSNSEREALGVASIDDLSTLRERLGELALKQRIQIKTLLDLPHIPYWLQPPMPVSRSFVAYPLWPSHRNQPVDLIRKVQELYPSFDRPRAKGLITSLGMKEPAVLLELEKRKAEYQSLEFGLSRWQEHDEVLDSLAADPQQQRRHQRAQIALKLLRAWRQEIAPVSIDGVSTYTLNIRLSGNSLPDTDFILGTQGFAHIGHLHLSADWFPTGGNAFLGKFTRLDTLKLECALTEIPTGVTDMARLRHLYLDANQVDHPNRIVLNEESRRRLARMTHLRTLNLDKNPLGIPPDVTYMTDLSTLSLRETGLTEWPLGATLLEDMERLSLEGNRITTVPPELFTDPLMEETNERTRLHDNPLSEDTLRNITAYRRRTGIALGGELPGPAHASPRVSDVLPWLDGIPPAEHAERRSLWDKLRQHEGADPTDTFSLIQDLTLSLSYKRGGTERQALVERVWNLLTAMGQSDTLRSRVYLATRADGTCGDGGLLGFMNMEMEHLQYNAENLPGTHEADWALLKLAEGMFYLRQLDEVIDQHTNARVSAGRKYDHSEATLYYRNRLAKEFNLPTGEVEMLYSHEEYVDEAEVISAQQTLRKLRDSPAPQASILQETFWIRYLEQSYADPFKNIADVKQLGIDALNKEVPDRRSEVYLERLQAILNLEIAERNRLIRQLTEAAQHARRRLDATS